MKLGHHLNLAFDEFEFGFLYRRTKQDSSEQDEAWTIGRGACGSESAQRLQARTLSSSASSGSDIAAEMASGTAVGKRNSCFTRPFGGFIVDGEK